MLENPWLSSSTILSLYAFLYRGHDFLRHHQIRPVANDYEDFAIRVGHFYS